MFSRKTTFSPFTDHSPRKRYFRPLFNPVLSPFDIQASIPHQGSLRELWDQNGPDRKQAQRGVQQMLQQRLNDFSQDLIEKTSPIFPGLIGEKVEVKLHNNHYADVTDEYVKAKRFMAWAMTENTPENSALRALLLLGLGHAGFAELKKGNKPAGYNFHHEVPRSLQACDNRPVHHATNLLLIQNGPKSIDDLHEALHRLILNPQLAVEVPTNAKKTTSLIIIKSSFPVYPPIAIDPATGKRPMFDNPEQVIARLEELEAGLAAKLPHNFRETWGRRIVAVSQVAKKVSEAYPGTEPFQVPKPFQSKKENPKLSKEERRLARKTQILEPRRRLEIPLRLSKEIRYHNAPFQRSASPPREIFLGKRKDGVLLEFLPSFSFYKPASFSYR